jgi:uncharacterized protein
MGKVIFWIVIVFLVLLGLRIANVAAAKRRTRESPKAKAPAAETMVRCARCGVYLPRADALPSGTGYLCGDPACSPRR